MLSYLFSGQGSQILGMGRELFDRYPESVALADDILGYSIKKLCVEDPHQQLHDTQYTQPALFVVNALTYLHTLEKNSLKPDYVAGHSLGEYNALLAADVFDFKTGVQLVKKRGELMSQAKNGSMMAVIGLAADELQSLFKQHTLSDITIANYNTYFQLIVSGTEDAIAQVTSILKSITTVSCIPLKVSGAFHSMAMLPAAQSFAEFLKSFTFAVPTLPVITNSDAAFYHPAIIQTNLVNQITRPVQWVKSMEYLLSFPNMQFEEIGPGKVLSGMLKRIRNKQ